jgi:nitric oxide reductase NorQ protein
MNTLVPPDPVAAARPFYLASGREIEVCEQAHRSRLPVMLKGPTGCGKTRFVEHMAARLGRELVTVACNEDTSATDLLGRHLLRGGDTVWVDGPLTRAVRGGALLYLDEIAEARADVIVVIHSLADHRREIFLDRTGETLRAPDGFMLAVSYNPGYQRSLREMKPSTRQRFVSIAFDYPSEDNETRIVAAESGAGEDVARKLVRIGRKIRNLTELALMESVSTRLLVAAGKLIAAGIPPRLACTAAIAEPLTDEAEALAAITRLIEISI